MTTNAIKAHGTTVVFDGITLGEVMSVGGGDSQRAIIRVFSCDTPDETAEKIAGGIEEGQLTLGIVYAGAATGTYEALYKKHRQTGGRKATLTVTYSDSSVHSGTALIASLGRPGFADAENTIVEFSVTFELSGEFEFANSAGSTASASPSTSASSSASSSPSTSAS